MMRELILPPHVEAPHNSNATDLVENHFIQEPNLALFARQLSPGEWTDVTVREFRQDVQQLARALASIGIEPGQSVAIRSEEHTSELQSRGHLVCRLLLEKKKKKTQSEQHTH